MSLIIGNTKDSNLGQLQLQLISFLEIIMGLVGEKKNRGS